MEDDAFTWTWYHTPTNITNTSTSNTSFDWTIPNSKEYKEINDRLGRIERRLCILDDPDPAIIEQHASLKEAYEHYKMLEKLILGNN